MVLQKRQEQYDIIVIFGCEGVGLFTVKALLSIPLSLSSKEDVARGGWGGGGWRMLRCVISFCKSY